LSNHKQKDPSLLAEWTYSRDEWKEFIRWIKLKKGLLTYLAHVLKPGGASSPPDVTITIEGVWVAGHPIFFRTTDLKLKKVDIRNEDNMNIMEISYEGADKNGMQEIRVLIPKGKLREAIHVAEILQSV
jgi:hypothetical protein